MSVALAGLFITACTEDYTDWAAQKSQYTAENAVTIPGFTASAAGAVDLNTADDAVSLVNLSSATLPEGYTIQNIRAEILPVDAAEGTEPVLVEADADGNFSKSELQALVEQAYGIRPVARTFNAHVYANAVYNGQAIYIDAGTTQVTITPEAPVIEQKYYATGTMNGWDNGNTDYLMTNDGSDPYDNPTFILRVPATADGSNVEFKVTPESKIGTGDWNSCLAYVEDGVFSYDNQGDNFVIEPIEDAVAYKVTFEMLDLTFKVEPIYSTPETWYLIGGCIGDGSWANSSLDNVGVSLYPLARIGNSTISYTGWFTTAGFKLIKTPGSWSEQWGQGSNGFVKNDGGSSDIKVETEGYYTVTLDYVNDILTVEPATVTPETYAVGMAGSFNGWTFQPMKQCTGNDHLWRYELSADSDVEAKFLIDGWSVNWGATDFPTGVGSQGGPNIPVERGSYIVIFNDITGGYNFIRTDAEPEPAFVPETWYLIGSCIGDGSWANNGIGSVGVSLIPLAYDGDCSVTYTGYFTTDGFKLIKTPGSWDEQWGQGASGYVKNDGGSSDIKLPVAGYYTVTLNEKTDELTIVAADVTPETYAVGIAGSFNGWSFQAIENCAGSSHLWRADFSAAADEELKFLIDGWSVNWGASFFPTGLGVNNGANIPVKAGDYVIIFNDIDGGYTFVQK